MNYRKFWADEWRKCRDDAAERAVNHWNEIERYYAEKRVAHYDTLIAQMEQGNG